MDTDGVRRVASGVVALTCLVALGIAGCAEQRQVADDGSPPGAITAVRLNAPVGDVTVRGTPGATTASVHREIRYTGDRPPGPTAHVDGTTLVLDGCGQHCSVSYTVGVPPGLPITGQVSAGDVELTAVGAVDVGTTDGAVSLDGVAGDARARTANGDVRGRDLRGGRADAETTNGGIDLSPATAQDVRAVTTNGEITLALPGNGYRVDARTVNGRRTVSVPTDPAGAHTVDAQTTNGSVTITPR